ncbi:MAG: hypothetical protein ACYTG0_14530, partial [Planctomycetota bacterium]
AVAPSWTQAAHAFPSPRPVAASPSKSSAAGPRLTTAAELAGGGQTPPASPDSFHQGMLVRHPRHGLGRVVALSGSGASRKATVRFASQAGQRKFVIAKSSLQPVGK